MDLDIDPVTLLEWLDPNACQDEGRELQANALERLCMVLLMSSNIDQCFETYSPDVFIPTLCRIFLDASSPITVLEVAARAITYYADVSSDCVYRILKIEGAVEAIVQRLHIEDWSNRTSRDLAEQCVKILNKMYDIEHPEMTMDGLIALARDGASILHKDAIETTLNLISRLCRHGDAQHIPDIRPLFYSEVPMVVEKALACLPYLVQRGAPLPNPLPPKLLDNPELLSILGGTANFIDPEYLLSAHTADNPFNYRLADTLVTCFFEKKNKRGPVLTPSVVEAAQNILENIRSGEYDEDGLVLSRNEVDVIYWVDQYGHSLLSWATAFGGEKVVRSLLEAGSDITIGCPLHIASCVERPAIVRLLLEYGTNFDGLDNHGRTPFATAKSRLKPQCMQLLSVASVFWSPPESNRSRSCDSSSPVSIESIFDALLTVPTNDSRGLRILYRLLHHLTSEEAALVLQSSVAPVSEPNARIRTLCEILTVCLRPSSNNVADENTLASLQLCHQLVDKYGELFCPLLFRLGVGHAIDHIVNETADAHAQGDDFNEILALADDEHIERQFVIGSVIPTGSLSSARPRINIGILQSRPLVWNDWYIVVTAEHAFVWNDHIALEFSRVSKGWFHCYADNRLLRVEQVSTSHDENQTEALVTSNNSLDANIDFLNRFLFSVHASVLAKRFSGAAVGSSAASDPESAVHNRSPDHQPLNLASVSIKLNSFWTLEKNNPDESSCCIKHSLCPNQNIHIVSKSQSITLSSSADGNPVEIDSKKELPYLKIRAQFTEQKSTIARSGVTAERYQAALREQLLNPPDTSGLPAATETQQQPGNNTKSFTQVKQKIFRRKIQHLGREIQACFARHQQSSMSEPYKRLNEYALPILGMSPVPLLDLLNCGNLTDFELCSSHLTLYLGEVDLAQLFLPHINHPGVNVLIKTLVLKLTENLKNSPPDMWPVPSTPARSMRSEIRQLNSQIKIPLHSLDASVIYPEEWKGEEKRLIIPHKAVASMNGFICTQQLKESLASKFVCSWYQQDRGKLNFIADIKKMESIPLLRNIGVLRWVGTNAGRADWVDPAKVNLMELTCSSSRGGAASSGRNRTSSGRFPLILNVDTSNSATTSETQATIRPRSSRYGYYFQLDTGVFIEPHSYRLTNDIPKDLTSNIKRPFGWQFKVSKNGRKWELAEVDREVRISSGTKYMLKEILDNLQSGERKGFRYVRLEAPLVTSPGGEAGNTEFHLDLSHFEIFGTIVGCVEDNLRTIMDRASAIHRFGQALRLSRQTPGRWTLRLPRESLPYELTSYPDHRDGISLQDIFMSCRRHLAPQVGSRNHRRNLSNLRAAVINEAIDQPNNISANNNDEETPQISSSSSSDESRHVMSYYPQRTHPFDNPLLVDIEEDDNQLCVGADKSDMTSSEELLAEAAENVAADAPDLRNFLDMPSQDNFSLPVWLSQRLTSHLQHDGQQEVKQGYGESHMATMIRSIIHDRRALAGTASPASGALSSTASVVCDATTAVVSPTTDERTSDLTSLNQNDEHIRQDTLMRLNELNELISNNIQDETNNDSDTNTLATMSKGQQPDLSAERMSSRQRELDNEMRILRQQLDMAEGYYMDTFAADDEDDGNRNVTMRTAQNSHEDDMYGLDDQRLMMMLMMDSNSHLAETDMIRESSSSAASASCGGYSKKSEEGPDDMFVRECCRTRREIEAAATSILNADIRDASESEVPIDDECEETLEDDENDVYEEDEQTSEDEVFDVRMVPRSIFVERKSRALAPSFDPRPGQVNVSSAADVDYKQQSSRGRSRRHRRKSERNSMMKMYIEFNPDHPIVKDKKIPSMEVEMLNEERTILWYMRRIMSKLEVSVRSEAWKQPLDKLFRLKLGLINSDCANCTVEDLEGEINLLETMSVVKILSAFYSMLHNNSKAEIDCGDQFCCTTLISIIDRMLQDAITISSGTCPIWVEKLIQEYPFLVPLQNRLRFLRATAFGTSRSLIWSLQNADVLNDFYASKPVGRLRHERCTVDRNRVFFDGCQLLEFHARHKAVMDVVWSDEDGTGLGPTLEFYTLFSRELQRIDLGMWMVPTMDQSDYIYSSFGLFPAPYPKDHPCLPEICRNFRILGILIAKCLQDGRQCCDLRLSDPLLKILCPPIGGVRNRTYRGQHDPLEVLTYDDFRIVEPVRARAFNEMINSKNGQSTMDLSELCLSFTYEPSHPSYKYTSATLPDHSADKTITSDNVDEYVVAVAKFVLQDGIRSQIDALIDGLTSVMDKQSLCILLPDELKLTLCGVSNPDWTRDELYANIEPKNGYSRESPMFHHVVSVFLGLNDQERREILQFITGCPQLPIGGLKALSPRLSVARKDGEGYPSVNTCNHFLKVPDYGDAGILRERLLVACKERGFYFN